MPEPKSHYESRGFLEQLLRKVPGFKGYLEKEYRRESDALQRQLLADRLQRSKKGLDDYARKLVDAVQIMEIPQCDRLRAKLDKLIGRIRGAMQGYSGMFDLVTINEAVLDKVYEFDVKLLDQVESLATSVEQLATTTARPSEVLPGVMSQVDSIEQHWDQRHDILKGVD